MTLVQAQPLEWDISLINKFWDYYSNFPEKYFTYRYGKNIVDELSKNLSPDSTILDYGCGTGFLMTHLLSKGFETSGADYSTLSVDFVNEKYKSSSNFKGATIIDELMKSSKKFDVIFVVEVIEHLNDKFLFELYDKVKKLVKLNGKIIFTTPNKEVLEDSMVFCPNCTHTFHRWQHMRSWTSSTLASSLEASGFRVQNNYTTNFAMNRKQKLYQKIAHPINSFLFSSEKPHLIVVCSL